MGEIATLLQTIDCMRDNEKMPLLHENIRNYAMVKNDWDEDKVEALLGQAEKDGLLKRCNLRDKPAYRRNYHKTNATIRDPIEIA